MEKNFWINKWESGEIGFHQEIYNKFLTKYWKDFTKHTGTVFVPLCGKTRDMLYLLEEGYEVIGVELSELAVREFFHTNRINYSITETQRFNIYRGDNLTIYCGDLFDLGEDDLGEIDFVYDRASIVALPFELRTSYIKFMFEKLVKAKYFLLTIEFDDHEIGPPFSINEKMVINYFSDRYNVAFKDYEKFTTQDIQVHTGKVSYSQNNLFLMNPKN